MKATSLIVIGVGLQLASAFLLRDARSRDVDFRPPAGFRLMKTSELVPHCMVDVHHSQSAGLSTPGIDDCMRACLQHLRCTGIQWERQNGPACVLRVKHSSQNSPQETCLDNFRWLSQDRGFKDIPLVPLKQSEGTVVMREDCMDETVMRENNTYWGFPWKWEQPGLSLVKRSGYGVSPLLQLVTPRVLDDLIVMGGPPWQEGRSDVGVDLSCHNEDSHNPLVWHAIMKKLRSSDERGLHGRALVVDVSKCICSMLSNGWDPREDLKTDAVLLFHRDENFSPASPYMTSAAFAKYNTKVPCISLRGNQSKFASDVEAFTALAESPHVRAMYFMQTPPISHEKIFLVPLGVNKQLWVRNILPHLKPDSPDRSQSRTALYDVSHNLAVDYRRDVFRTVQASFAPEPLHARYVPWASETRMADIAEEALQAVFGQSPIGIGENCFRHGELLLTGVIPVVQGSLGVAAMRYLPHLAVSNWHEVTPELLRRSYSAIWDDVSKGRYSFAPLTRGFWQQHIQDRANGLPIPEFYAKFPNPPVTCRQWNCTGPM